MWTQICLTVLIATLSSACDEACIQACLSEEDVDASCFEQCTCNSPIRVLPFGKSFETESGAEYAIQALVYTEYDWVEKHTGCDISCAVSCYGISKGQELVSCFRLCACSDLLRPKNEQALQERARSQALQTSGLLTSAACADQCSESCQSDDDSFSKCFIACTRKLCMAPVPMPAPSIPLYQNLYVIGGLGAVAAYVYTRWMKKAAQAYKSL